MSSVTRLTLLFTYVIAFVTLILISIASGMEYSNYAERVDKQRDAAAEELAAIDGKPDKVYKQLFETLNPRIVVTDYSLKYRGLWIASAVLWLITIVMWIVASFILDMGLGDFILSFPFRQWNRAISIDKTLVMKKK